MQLYERGIRRRLAPMLDGDRRRLELAYSLLFTLPGTPVLRYGDEIGMGDDLSLPERECGRTPMQWSTEPHGGFTKSDAPVKPVISGGPYGYEYVNVAEQHRNPNSMMNWLERIIRMRKEVPEIGWGLHDPEIARSGHPCHPLRLAEQFGADPQHRRVRRGQFRLGPDERGAHLIDLLGPGHSHADASGTHKFL